MKQLYKWQAWMVEGTYIVGVKPRSLGEGVLVEVHSIDYEMVYAYWLESRRVDYGVFQYTSGVLKWIGKRIRGKDGIVRYVPIPPARLIVA